MIENMLRFAPAILAASSPSRPNPFPSLTSRMRTHHSRRGLPPTATESRCATATERALLEHSATNCRTI
ncbi:hypothetical protein GS506_15970 [Rhodococcus hoagii]|nr:hypothetical protein [Prescottella equi]